MSVKVGFTTTTSKQNIHNIWIKQKNSLCCLPSRDRTAGLKIPDYVRFDPPRGIEVQLQSCALPAELRRVDELVCSRDDSYVGVDNTYHQVLLLEDLSSALELKAVEILTYHNGISSRSPPYY
jgi:hypothetical protein